MAKELRTLVLVCENKIISPPLVTVREYASWMEKYFDTYTCHLELYLNSKKNGDTVSEWHPGTKIGKFFDMQNFKSNPDLISWFIPTDTKAMQQLIKHGFASANDSKNGLLRLYTVQQIELYIRTAIDNSFQLGNKIIDPKQITLATKEKERLVRPRIIVKRKLF